MEDTQAPNTPGYGGTAVAVLHGGTLSCMRVLARRAHAVALIGKDAGSELDLTDVTVKDTLPPPADQNGAMGLYIYSGASATVRRLLVDGGSLQGVADLGTGTLSGTDVTIENVGPTPGPHFNDLGFGIDAQLGAQVDLTRVSISHATGVGALIRDATTQVALHDLRIDHTEATPTGYAYADLTRLGRGLELQAGATVDVEHAVFAQNREIAVHAFDTGSVLTLDDVLVRDTQSEVSTNSGGEGIEAHLGAHVTVTGARLERNREVAVAAYNTGTSMTLSDVHVLDTAENACAADTCADTSAGFGMVSADGAALAATHFLVTRSALCGVQVAGGAGLDLSDGEVSYSPIGANVQVPDFDVARISHDVVYDNNQSNLDAETLPVPDPVVGLPSMM